MPTELRFVEGDIKSALLKIANETLPSYRFHYLTAAEFNQNETIAWFNGVALHSAPLSLNLVHNAMVKSSLGHDHSICLTNKPFPLESAQDKFDSDSQEVTNIMRELFGLLFAVFIYIAMSIHSARFITFYIEVCNHQKIQCGQKENKTKICH